MRRYYELVAPERAPIVFSENLAPTLEPICERMLRHIGAAVIIPRGGRHSEHHEGNTERRFLGFDAHTESRSDTRVAQNYSEGSMGAGGVRRSPC